MLSDHLLEMMTEEVEQKQQGFVNRPDVEVLLRETLNDEIHQVIFKESLNESVMNLVLYAENNGLDSSTQDPLFEAEGNDARNANGSWGIDGVYDEKEGLKGNYENQGAEEHDKVYTYEQRRRESIGDHMFTNEDAGPGGGWRPGERSNIYPVRPDAEDCAYYMKTGTCKFGATCKFNHSFKKKNLGLKAKHKTRIEDLEQQGPNECKYYMTPGGCKYGKACKYNHIRERNAVAPILEFNFLGLPIRLGEKECPYYLRHGSCKYGPSCKFNHPQPTSVATTEPAPSYSIGGSARFQSSAQLTTSSWSAMSMLLPANQHVPLSNPDWNGYPQAQVYPPTTSVRSLPTPPAFAVNNMAGEANSFAHHQQQMMPNDEYPERPGEPECSYFLKTGDCKFKSNCRFHHPKARLYDSTSCALSAKGLPLRPDQSVCSFYNRYGICKFGPGCKFDHPENWGNFAFSDGARMPRKEREVNLT